MLNSPQRVYITIEWQEQGPLDATGQRLWRQGRHVITYAITCVRPYQHHRPLLARVI